MGRLIVSATVLLWGLAALSRNMAAGRISGEGIPPQQDFRIRVDVEMVPVDVTVHGTPVRELRMEDFIVYDNDVRQQLIYYSRDEVPLAVALLVDSSGSLALYLPELRSAARWSLESLKAEDQVVLFAFSTFPARLSDFTRDHSLIAQKLAGLMTVGSTNIWDGIFIASHYLGENAPDRRRAVILVSDNGQIVNWGQTANSALQEALETGTTIYAIQAKGTGSLYAESDAVRKVVNDTGGAFVEVADPKSLPAALHQSFSKIRLQYSLGFTIADTLKDGSFHRLRVSLRSEDLCPGCRLLARKGYYAGTPAPPGAAGPERRTLPPGTKVDVPTYNRITIAAAEMSDLEEIPFEAQMTPAAGYIGRLRTNVIVRIDPNRIVFKDVNGRSTARLCVALFMALADGVYYATEWRNLDVQPKSETDPENASSTIPFLAQIRGSPSILKVVVCDLQGNRIGAKLVRR